MLNYIKVKTQFKSLKLDIKKKIKRFKIMNE